MKKILFIIQLVVIASVAYYFYMTSSQPTAGKWVVYAINASDRHLFITLLDSTTQQPSEKKDASVSSALFSKVGLGDTIVDLRFKSAGGFFFKSVRPCSKELHVITPVVISYCEIDGAEFPYLSPFVAQTPQLDAILMHDEKSCICFVNEADKADEVQDLLLQYTKQQLQQHGSGKLCFSAVGQNICISCDELAIEAFPANLYP